MKNIIKDSHGFSLLELMVVLLILGVLATLVMTNIVTYPEEARRQAAATNITAIEQALKMYKLDNGVYPSTEQGLQALVEAPSVGRLAKKWRKGGYMDKGKIPRDPWDNEFVYICPGIHSDFDLISYGPDGEPGGEDMDADINNWEL